MPLNCLRRALLKLSLMKIEMMLELWKMLLILLLRKPNQCVNFVTQTGYINAWQVKLLLLFLKRQTWQASAFLPILSVKKLSLGACMQVLISVVQCSRLSLNVWVSM